MACNYYYFADTNDITTKRPSVEDHNHVVLKIDFVVFRNVESLAA